MEPESNEPISTDPVAVSGYLNLRDEPLVEVATKNEEKHQRRARIATAEERNEMWPQIVERYKNYGGYQSRTQREIPLILLEKIG